MEHGITEIDALQTIGYGEKGGVGRGEPTREGKNFRHKTAFFIFLSKGGVRTFSLGILQGRT